MSQCVVFEIATYAMIEYIFELPLNNYAISTLISLGIVHNCQHFLNSTESRPTNSETPLPLPKLVH